MATEAALILRLRQDVGDNPTDELDVADTSLQIWTDTEHLAQLNSSRILMFKGQQDDLITLTELQDELLILHSTIKLNYVLAQDATRYVKYKIRDVNVEKLSPSEFLQIAKALEKRLEKTLLDVGEETGLGDNVVVSTIRRYDRLNQEMTPSRYAPPSAIPNWRLSSVATGVQINIDYLFIHDYSTHYIKRMVGASGESGTVIKSYDILKDSFYIDDDSATESTAYRFRLFVEDINGNTTYKELSITYAAP